MRLGEEIIPIFSKVFNKNIMMMERESGAFHFYGRSSGYANTGWVHDEVPPMLLKVGSVEAGDAHYDVLGFENPPKWEEVVMQWCDDQRYHGPRNAIQAFHLSAKECTVWLLQ